tara:strand:- start:429 stop:632 length:204 start_codon:yes stop_codon:yes gene_type:complete
MSEIFEYNDKASYEDNFNRWYRMNEKEKREHNEEPHSITIAKRIFSEQYGKKRIKEKLNDFINPLKK